MPQFAPFISLASLDGSNGFRLDGIDPGDTSGISVAAAGDVNGDGFDDILIGAPGEDPGLGDEGVSYVVFGKASGFPASLSLLSIDGTNGFRLTGISIEDYSGNSVASAGDVNGDGFDDILIGAFSADPGGDSAAGESYVVFGRASGSGFINLATLDGTNGFRLDGIDANDLSGFSLASAGDVNGDGFDDIVIGARGGDPGGDLSAGESYVVFGKASSFGASLNVATLDGTDGFRLDGIDASDLSGFAVASAGDINGDGFDDILIGAYLADPNGDGLAGESYVVFGKASGFAAAVNLATLDGTNGFRLDGIDPGDTSGYSVACAGDVNGDGFDDILIGAPRGDPVLTNAGESCVVFGKASGFAAALDLSTLDGTNGFRLDGIDGLDQSGISVASAGDFNGDGFDDILIGARDADPGGDGTAGESYVVFGKASGFAAAIKLGALDGNNGFRIDGIDAGDESGRSVSAAGDVNGDGFDDILIGAPQADPGGDSAAGESYVVFGHRAFTSVARVGTELSQTINGGFGDDTISGLDGADRLLGWEGDDAMAGGAGADTLDGGAGNDTITGGSGKDVFKAGAGEDDLNGGSEKDQWTFAGFGPTPISLNLSTGQFIHPNGEDLQTFASVEDVVGTSGNDTVTGNFVINSLNGAQGDDIIDGAGGNDLVIGGGGKDTLKGGLGSDRFDYNAVSESAFGSATRDVIQDFTVDPAASAAFVDRLDFSTIDAMAGLVLNQAFAFIGTAAFTAEGQIRAFQSGANTIVQINTTGTNGAEMEVQVTTFTASTLQAADFVL